MSTIYTCGFQFSLHPHDRRYDTVLLVNKLRPEWQTGLWNGVGGMVESGETPRDCMYREFVEETGVEVPKKQWHGFAHEAGPGYEVYFFRVFLETEIAHNPSNDRGEPLSYFTVAGLPTAVRAVGNLNWLIPMARDPRAIVARIRTPDDIRKEPTW